MKAWHRDNNTSESGELSDMNVLVQLWLLLADRYIKAPCRLLDMPVYLLVWLISRGQKCYAVAICMFQMIPN